MYAVIVHFCVYFHADLGPDGDETFLNILYVYTGEQTDVWGRINHITCSESSFFFIYCEITTFCLSSRE